MANPSHIENLVLGVSTWNFWRKEHPDEVPDLAEADLRGLELQGINLSDADLSNVDLRGADLRQADLTGAGLSEAQLFSAILLEADLREARLFDADCRRADLRKAKLRSAVLLGTRLHEADLRGADLSGARLKETLFINTNLSAADGLDSCQHEGPSPVDFDTLIKSGRLPRDFLRGVGLPDVLIDYLPSLVSGDPIQYYGCFISFSSQDHSFAERLYKDLQNQGVRCWFAPKSLQPGDFFRSEIDRAIHKYEKLLLILSEHSIASSWVADEVEAALERERRTGEKVLFPIQIDDAVRNAGDWAAALRRRRHIGDMRAWRDPDAYRRALLDFLTALKTERSAPKDDQ